MHQDEGTGALTNRLTRGTVVLPEAEDVAKWIGKTREAPALSLQEGVMANKPNPTRVIDRRELLTATAAGAAASIMPKLEPAPAAAVQTVTTLAPKRRP